MFTTYKYTGGNYNLYIVHRTASVEERISYNGNVLNVGHSEREIHVVVTENRKGLSPCMLLPVAELISYCKQLEVYFLYSKVDYHSPPIFSK